MHNTNSDTQQPWTKMTAFSEWHLTLSAHTHTNLKSSDRIALRRKKESKENFPKFPYYGYMLKLNGGKQIADLYFITVATFISLRNSGQITEVALTTPNSWQ